MITTALTIDTATAAVIAGVVRRGDDGAFQTVTEHITIGARAHAEQLTPNVIAAVRDSGMTVAQLDAVVVGCGPGPFTGLRVGMATAAAYAHALDIPVFGVCTLDTMGVQTRGAVLAVTDARRREVYWARYRDGVRVDGPAVSAPADVPLGDATHVAGDPDMAALFTLPQVGPTQPSPLGLALAVSDWDTPPDPLVPLYLRRPDAKTLAERGLPS